MVRGLVDQDVILAGKQPGQRAGCERIAAVAEQVGGAAADDEVDLQLDMAMRVRSNVADAGRTTRPSTPARTPRSSIIARNDKKSRNTAKTRGELARIM
jgi:hypothetical protein